MKILPCGIRVTTIIAGHDGMITGANIRWEKVTYAISYFNVGAYNEIWMHESEFTINSKQPKRLIGFQKLKPHNP